MILPTAGSNLSVDVRTSQTPGMKQVFVSGAAPFTIQSSEATVESNGSSYRGAVVNSSNAWAVFSNTPGSRLDASLGSNSLQYAYAGVGHIRDEAGTRATALSPHRACWRRRHQRYADVRQGRLSGGFEGIENSALTGQPMKVSNISGKANLSADFAAKTFAAVLMLSQNQQPPPRPFKQAAGYASEFRTGAISGLDLFRAGPG